MDRNGKMSQILGRKIEHFGTQNGKKQYVDREMVTKKLKCGAKQMVKLFGLGNDKIYRYGDSYGKQLKLKGKHLGPEIAKYAIIRERVKCLRESQFCHLGKARYSIKIKYM